MNKILKQPVFWLGTAAITFAFFSSNNDQAQSGVRDGLVIVATGVGVAAVIYAVNRP